MFDLFCRVFILERGNYKMLYDWDSVIIILKILFIEKIFFFIFICKNLKNVVYWLVDNISMFVFLLIWNEIYRVMEYNNKF